VTAEKFTEEIVDEPIGQLDGADIYAQITITSTDGEHFDVLSKLPIPNRDRLIILLKLQEGLDILGPETITALREEQGDEAVDGVFAAHRGSARNPLEQLLEALADIHEGQAERDAEDRAREADLFDRDGARGAEPEDVTGGGTDDGSAKYDEANVYDRPLDD
jgi:hypothetical protein